MAAATAAQVLAVTAAEKLFAVALASMASPKSLGHIAAALHRGCVGIHQTGEDVEQEVAARVALIQPVIHEQVAAGAGGRVPRISGTARAKRNLATHSLLGQGSDVLEEACLSPQKAQRGGRQLQMRNLADEIKHKDLAVEAATHLKLEEQDQERQHLDARIAELASGLKDLVGVVDSIKSDMHEISAAMAGESLKSNITETTGAPTDMERAAKLANGNQDFKATTKIRNKNEAFADVLKNGRQEQEKALQITRKQGPDPGQSLEWHVAGRHRCRRILQGWQRLTTKSTTRPASTGHR